MAYRRTPLAVDEWFHCYSRTIDRSRPFESQTYIQRFLEMLYLANQAAPVPVMPHLYQKYSHNELFSLERKSPLVRIGAYCIMPTHYHILAQPVIEDGLSNFMHKVGTGFTRFYNDREKRVGNLFVGPFRSKHVATDGYFGRVASYIHLNPIELFEPEWKRGKIREIGSIRNKLLKYPHTSLLDYDKTRRPQRSILDEHAMQTMVEHLPSPDESIRDAAVYYQFLELDL